MDPISVKLSKIKRYNIVRYFLDFLFFDLLISFGYAKIVNCEIFYFQILVATALFLTSMGITNTLSKIFIFLGNLWKIMLGFWSRFYAHF